MKVKFFKKYLLVSLLSSVLFIVGGSFVARQVMYSVWGSKVNPATSFPFFVALLALFSVLSVLLSLGVLLLYFRKKAEVARLVIFDLKAGKLKSRFPLEKIDETGQLMLEFNKMADEIELLVGKLESSESTRKQLLQDLSHDLKTPLAGLRIVLENLIDHNHTIDADKRLAFLNTCHEETLFIGQLIDDLLFLSIVDEANYALNKSPINLVKVLSNEVTNTSAMYSKKGIRIEFSKKENEHLLMYADETLLKRLFRNLISNAASFAKNKVEVILEHKDNHTVHILIKDDGEGFPEELLKAYGQRAITQKYLTNSKGRASHGLGSVISLRIISLHGGKLIPQNRLTDDGAIAGADIMIKLSV